MAVELPYTDPPQWQVTRPSTHELLNGAPPLVVVLTGETPDGLHEAYDNMRTMMGWAS